MLKKVLLGVGAFLAVVIVVFVAVVAVQPADYRVSRSATVAAPASAVFAQVNDFHNWQAWSPWAKLDPNAKNSFEGPPAGVGAIFRWNGNDDVGEGKMTILESNPNELVRIKLEFIRPFPDAANVEFELKPAGEKTAITWSMFGKNETFMSKAFCLVMNLDKMVGGDYEKGLASIKSIVEKGGANAGDEKSAGEKTGATVTENGSAGKSAEPDAK